MRRVSGFLDFLWVFIVVVAVAAGCSGSPSTTANLPATALSPLPAPVAFLVYPTSAPAIGSGGGLGPIIQGSVGQGLSGGEQLVFAVQGSLNASYQLTVSAPQTPIPGTSPCFSNFFTASPQPWSLTFNPTTLPSPLLSPPGAGPFTYVLATGPRLNQTTAYTVALTGCPGGTSCASPVPAYTGTLQTGCTNQIPPTTPPSPVLVYPSNGATGAPDALGSVVVSGAVSPFGTVTITLTTSSGAEISNAVRALVSPWPTSLPTTASYEQTANLPVLAQATTYAVSALFFVPTATPPCSTPLILQLGSFTTQ